VAEVVADLRARAPADPDEGMSLLEKRVDEEDQTSI
jgi:hypothetical protein